MPKLRRVLVLHDRMDLTGGGSTLGAWVVEALKGSDYDLSVLTWWPIDVAVVDRKFGTALSGAAIEWISVNGAVRRLVDALPGKLYLLRFNLMFRTAQRLHAERPYDVIFGSLNECYVGPRAIQYFHHPGAFFNPRQLEAYPAYTRPLLRAYRRFCNGLSGFNQQSVVANQSLANSRWTAGFIATQYGRPVRVVYPPVPGGFSDVPWDRRENSFVCIGRVSPEKRVDDIINILARVRERGHDVRLRIVGSIGDKAYMKQVETAVAHHQDWVELHIDLPRRELVKLIAQNRFGIHGMNEEHFGIAPAELQRAGCITFVRDDGGQVEVVAGDERVIYHSNEDAVDKIDRVLSDPHLEAALRKDVAARADRFSERRFMDEVRDVVDRFRP